jgi:salicylate hydroxylase
MSQVYSRVRQPWCNFVVEATRLQGKLYEFSTAAFENVKEGDEIPLETLEKLGKKIRDGWSWTWKSSSRVALRKGLAML